MRVGLYQALLSVAFMTLTHAHAVHGQEVLEQKVSFRLANADVEQVLEKIEAITSVKFMYNPQIFGADPKLSYTFRNELLSEVLNKVLSRHQVSYEVVQERIILKRQGFMPDINAPARPEAPKRRLTGTVLDEKGAGLPGVSVVLKETQRGTTTSAEGTFSLELPDNSNTVVLVFSFVGYRRQEVAVGNQSDLSVSLVPEASTLNEVVVTAFGISKDKKAVAYSVAEVKGDEFIQARENNVANALTGKIAGVNATGLNTGPGGSSRVVIRGNGSLNGANQPLYVVNGMPIDNTVPGGGPTSNGSGTNVDRGDGIGGINPDDIETISVLKGGAAAALYGSRAANGVILITTKRGKVQRGIGVEYNTTLTFDTPSVFPDYQYEYGQGLDGVKPTTQAQAISTGRLSFGAKMDGQPSIQFDGQLRPYSPVYAKDNIKNFWRTGTNYVNTVALTGGNESVTYRFSVSDNNAQSLQPNSTFNRKTANLNLNANLGKRLHIETVAQYNLEKAVNRPSAGDAYGNPSWAVNVLANTVDIRSLAPGYGPDGKEIQWNPVPLANNSYFVVNKWQNNDLKNRFIGQANIKYDILDNLFVQGRISRDFYNFGSELVVPTNTAYNPLGEYYSLKSDVTENNAMLTLNYNTKFLRDFSVSAFAGVNKQRYINNQTNINGTQFIIPYFYSYTNLNTLTTVPSVIKTGTNSVFASADFDYKNVVFLSFTGRQDWFSTLSPQNNSIFYPSVGGSLVLSDVFKLPRFVTFAKLRGSWAQVGGSTVDAYSINQTYSMVQGGHNGRAVQTITSGTVTNPDLRPLTSTTSEIGLDAQFLNKRLGIDLTFYNRKTTNDIVQTTISTASGYNQAVLNVGELSNKGIELLLSGTPVKTADFGWRTSYNVAYNKSQVVRLAEGINTIQIAAGIGGATIANDVGRPYGIIKGYRIKTNDAGQTVYNSVNNYEVRGSFQELGVGVAPLTMGFTNDFTYKRFSLNVLLDGKFGNSIFSTQNQYAYRFGLLKATLPGRENGLQLTGVNEKGDAFSKTISVPDLDTYYDNRKNYTELFVFDGSFVKLRQIILGYSLPVSRLAGLKIQSVNVSFVARNLAILYKKTEGFDPESSYTSGNGQGFEAFGLPRTRSYGFNLLVKL